MAEADYNRYKNMFIFAKEWRGFNVSSKMVDFESFRKQMHGDQYVKIEATHDGKKIFMYLFDANSKYTAKSPQMKLLLKKIPVPSDVIMVTAMQLSQYHRKTIAQNKLLNIYVYRNSIFDLVIPKAPGTGKHRIMSREEVLQLTNNDLCCWVNNLPKIYDSDPQCVWIGAKFGDVIEVTRNSHIIGESIAYFVVMPKSTRAIASKELKATTDIVEQNEADEADESNEADDHVEDEDHDEASDDMEA